MGVGNCRVTRREISGKHSTSRLTNATPTLRVPVIPDGLLEHLRDIFRPSVDPAYDLRNYDRQVGQQEVIEYLAKTWVEQNPEE